MTDNPYFILLETATDSCSAALSCGDKIIFQKYICTPKAHAVKLAPFVEELLQETGLTIKDIAAVGVSEGPGSYTGLRVGTSLAKGICFGADIPLIAVGTLDVIAQVAIDNNQYGLFSASRQRICNGSTCEPVADCLNVTSNDNCYIVPMIDAGRMEVYTAVFNSRGERLTDVEAKILDETSFVKELAEKPVLFTGNGAAKFRPLAEGNKNALFAEDLPHASGLRVAVYNKFFAGKREDTAYFQPFYLKEFVAGKPKKLLLY